MNIMDRVCFSIMSVLLFIMTLVAWYAAYCLISVPIPIVWKVLGILTTACLGALTATIGGFIVVAVLEELDQ